jgi:predicted ester cyclase
LEVRDQFVWPFSSAFPGNIHEIQNLVYRDGVVAVEWVFRAVHQGTFHGAAPTGNDVAIPGCSFYTLQGESIMAARIYFNMSTLLQQIGVAS